MSERCDLDIEHSIVEALSDAAPRLAPRRKREMRRQLLTSIRGGVTPYHRFLANRAAALFVASATMVGSMSVAAAVAKPGQPAYPLRAAFVAVQRAILPPASPRAKTTGTMAPSRAQARASSRPEEQTDRPRRQASEREARREVSSQARSHVQLRRFEDVSRQHALRRTTTSHSSRSRAASTKRVRGHSPGANRSGSPRKP